MSDREELLRVKARESRYKKEAEERIASLEERVASLEAELASATEKAEVAADEAEKRIACLEGLLSDARARDEAAQREIAELKAKLKAASTLLEDKEKEHKESGEKKKAAVFSCVICGYEHNPLDHDGVAFENLPSDWTCPVCGAGKDLFIK